MQCPVCGVNIESIRGANDHIFIAKDIASGHIHTHTSNKKENLKELFECSLDELQIYPPHTSLLDKKEVVFHNRQRIGDMLVFTCAIRDFKKVYPNIRVNVSSTASHIWDYNPYIDRTLKPTTKNTINIGPSKLTNSSNRLDWHFTNAFRISIEDALKIHIPQGESRPDIWFTEEEYNSPRITEKPYWIICITGEKGWGCKMYPFEKWQSFINQNPDVLFYQIGTKEDNPTRLQGPNVIDYVGMTQDKHTGIRSLFKLFLHAEGSIGLVSFHMHLSGALYKPCIVVAGAREPVSFTRYPGHQYLATDGCLPCATNACWHCDIKACNNLIDSTIPKCVHIIEPDDLTKALNNYYIGGRLNKERASNKPKLKNIVPTPEQPIIEEQPKLSPITPKELENFRHQFGIPFTSGSIHKHDWEFIEKVIDQYKIKTVLEFGAGLSTILMYKKGLDIVSYEDKQTYIDQLKEKYPELNIKYWDSKTLNLDKKFDLVFVDGPLSSGTREYSIKIASETSNRVIIHDAHSPSNKNWITKYLSKDFEPPIEGGCGNQRCNLFIRKTVSSPIVDKSNIVLQSSLPKIEKSFIKIVSTARGWGGCSRSITTIMKMLLDKGYKVEFIPFRNSVGSREFKQALNTYLKDVIVTENYNTVSKPCDIFFMYADDYVWEFDSEEVANIFSYIKANKKIMVLNYRRGKVGSISWTRNWDKYMFLNSTQENELLKIHPGVKTKVLPPCTQLDEFLKIQPNYERNLRIVRHSSQGDTKFYSEIVNEISEVLNERLDSEFFMLPGPSYISASNRFTKVHRTDDIEKLCQFLGNGNLFWYSLPKGYMDMGPRVILEAMAAGLPVIADNWGGAIDRITPNTGWICNTKQEQVEIMKNISLSEVEKRGKAAKQYAIDNFIPQCWIKEIIE